MKLGTVLVALAGLGLVTAGAIGGLSWFRTAFDPCANVEIARVPSPDGGTDAVVYRRDCGASTAYSTQVALLARGQEARAAGNVLVVSMSPVEVTWIADMLLGVIHEAGAQVFRQEEQVGAVGIRYATAEALAP